LTHGGDVLTQAVPVQRNVWGTVGRRNDGIRGDEERQDIYTAPPVVEVWNTSSSARSSASGPSSDT
jgi:hypothetical protein